MHTLFMILCTIYNNKYKEKLVILQSIPIIVINSTVITYTSQYSSGHLIPIIHFEMTEL